MKEKITLNERKTKVTLTIALILIMLIFILILTGESKVYAVENVKITYDLNDGISIADDKEIIEEEVPEGTTINFDQDFYDKIKNDVFIILQELDYVEINGTSYAKGTSYTANANTTIKLIWKLQEGCVWITRDLNGGTIYKSSDTVYKSPYNPTSEITSTITLSELPPAFNAPEGKVFDGVEANGVRYKMGDTFKITGDTYLKYMWKDKEYINRIDLMVLPPVAGTEVEKTSNKRYYGQTNYPMVFVDQEANYEIATDNDDENFPFVYWYKDQALKDMFYGTIAENTTYYADISIRPKYGYDFTNDVKVYINGEEVNVYDIRDNNPNRYLTRGYNNKLYKIVEVSYAMESYVRGGLLTVNTEGYGQIEYAPEGNNIEFDDEYPITSIYEPIKGTYKIAAKAGKGHKFVKWTKNGVDYSTDSEITITLDDEDIDLRAVFEFVEGEVEIKETNNNVGKATIVNDNKSIKDLIELSSDDEYTLAIGENIYLFVEVNDISNSVSDTDKQLVQSKLDENSTVGMYLDINLFKQIEGEDKVKIEKTNGKIKISFEIPESLKSSNREFYIIRVHNGVATKITPTIEGNILTFETDQFSTYALAYNDVKQTTASSNPKTGDDIIITFSIFIIATLGMSAIIILNKKYKEGKC